MMLLTALVALWLTVYRFNSAFAWLLLPWWITSCLSIILGKVTPFFWQPFVTVAGWQIRSVFMPWWVAPHRFAFPIDAGIAATLAVFIYAQSRTIAAYRHQPSRNGIVFSAIRYGFVAGILVGLMLGVSMLVFVVIDLTGTNLQGIRVAWEVWAIPIGLPFAGAVFGILLGIGVGFVCDVLLAIEFRKRRCD